MAVWSGPIERFDCAEAGSHEHSPSPASILTITPNVLLFYRCNPVVLASISTNVFPGDVLLFYLHLKYLFREYIQANK